MNGKIVVVTLTIIVISLVLSACHHGRHRSATHNESHAIEHLAKKLDLSPSQKVEFAEVQTTFKSFKQERDSIKADWYSYALNQLDAEGSATDGEEFSRNQAVLIKAMAQSFADSVAEMKNILTSEQQQVLVAELKKHRNHIRH
jgi:Spy/CpxP family protein refolding chaperone